MFGVKLFSKSSLIIYRRTYWRILDVSVMMKSTWFPHKALLITITPPPPLTNSQLFIVPPLYTTGDDWSPSIPPENRFSPQNHPPSPTPKGDKWWLILKQAYSWWNMILSGDMGYKLGVSICLIGGTSQLYLSYRRNTHVKISLVFSLKTQQHILIQKFRFPLLKP